MSHYPFSLQSLPYPLNGLEPHLDCLTVAIHHDRLQRGYQQGLNELLSQRPQLWGWTLEQLICGAGRLEQGADITFQAGGLWAHELYFDCMTRTGAAKRCPSGILAQRICGQFGDFSKFQKAFTTAALGLKGSGWGWLATDHDGKLSIFTTPLHETPLTRGLYPVLTVDLWEHAYYLKYQNHRDLYLQNWWQLVDWDFAGRNYLLAIKNGTVG